MPYYCCVPICSNSSAEHKMHILPSDMTEFAAWMKLINRRDIWERAKIKGVNIVRKSYKVCDAHFSDDAKFIENRNKANLKHATRPSLYLPEPLLEDLLSEKSDIVQECAKLTVHNVNLSNSSVEPLVEPCLKKDIIQAECNLSPTTKTSNLISTRLIANIEMDGNICLICKYTGNHMKWIDINHTYTSHTNTQVFQFLGTITDNLSADYNIICEKCFDLINDLDFTHKKYLEIKEKLLNYFNQSKPELDVNLLPNVDEIVKKEEQVINENEVTEITINENIHEETIALTRKQLQCDLCEKTFKTSSNLKAHLNTHNPQKPFVCDICGKVYKQKNALNIHIGMHNNINPFKCTFCNKSFTQRGALQRHLPMHTGEYPYQCDECGKRYVHHSSFNIHRLTHTGKKEFKCHLCDIALLSKSHLSRHLRTHTGEKNNVCSICGKKFAEKYNLVAHQRLHDNSVHNKTKLKYKCVYCFVTFIDKVKLNEHHLSEHKNLIMNFIPKVP